jgi:MYXO-CTERM domain-containing protein
MLTALLSLSLSSPPAHACGGFFCNSQPMDQSAERIVFAIDEIAKTVEMHVQVTYDGSAEEFAWVVPVPDVPELFVSTDTLFEEVSMRFAPQFTPTFHEEGKCTYGGWYGYSYDDYALGTPDFSSSPESGGGVIVVDEREVGPYDTATLQAKSTEDLLEWLQENDYDLPDAINPALAPYVADGAYFVALKLQADMDTGDLQPLAMEFAGTRAMIPIQLTSIAATPDMRLEVYVLGKHRAVPENYLHVQINDAAIDWFSWGSNYEETITWAADEAGGQAFATDYSATSEPLKDYFYQEGWYDTAALALQTDVVAFMDRIRNDFPSNNTLFAILTEFVPPPEGVDAQSFYNWTEDYEDLLKDYTFDPVVAAAEIEERVIEPLRRSNDLFEEHPRLTRLTSSISPVEMTIDPMFVFNPDMPEVDGVWNADIYYLCGNGNPWAESNKRVELPDGRQFLVPSDKWLYDHDLTYGELLTQITDYYAKIIERTGENGEPEMIWSLGGENGLQDIDDFDAGDDDASSTQGACGCSTEAPASLTPMMLVLALAVARRRRMDETIP